MTDPSPFSTSPFGPDLWEVLARFLAGESPAGESEAVRQWLAQDPRRAQAIGLLERSFSALAFVPPADINVEAALAQVRHRLQDQDDDVLAGPRPGARLTTRGVARAWRAAAVIALVAGAGAVWRLTQSGPAGEPATLARAHTTGIGETDSLRLPDGTLAVLGPASTLEIAAGYNATSRTVVVHGEAFFDVVHNGDRPFVVRVGETTIEDIGTAFMVRYDSLEGVEVVVTEGSVRLQAEVVLEAGDRGSVLPDGRPVVERSSASADDLAWTRGRLVFDNASLGRVRAELRRWYGIELRLADSALATRHLTASFAGESGDQVLRVIALALGARIEQRGDTVFIRSR